MHLGRKKDKPSEGRGKHIRDLAQVNARLDKVEGRLKTVETELSVIQREK